MRSISQVPKVKAAKDIGHNQWRWMWYLYTSIRKPPPKPSLTILKFKNDGPSMTQQFVDSLMIADDCSLPIYQESNHLWVGHVTSIKRMWLNISFCHIKKWKHHRTLTAITTTYDPVEDQPDNVQKQTWQILLREQTFLRASNSYLKSSWGVTGIWVSRKWRINVKENETKVHWVNITWRKR